MWNKMSKDQKRYYQELSDRDRKRFDFQRKCWNSMHEATEDDLCVCDDPENKNLHVIGEEGREFAFPEDQQLFSLNVSNASLSLNHFIR